MSKKLTPISLHLAAATILAGPFVMTADAAGDYRALDALGINFSDRDVRDMAEAFGLERRHLFRRFVGLTGKSREDLVGYALEIAGNLERDESKTLEFGIEDQGKFVGRAIA